MKNKNQFMQTMKCCLTIRKIALLLFISILLFTSCGNNNKELSGTYATTSAGRNYSVSFSAGHSIIYNSPGGNQFSGTYTFEDKVIHGDFGLLKLNFTVIDETTLSFNELGENYTLTKK